MAINWQDVIISAFTTVGGGAVFLGAAAWLLKAVITDRLKANADAAIERVRSALTQETEAFKIRLKADADKQNEQLRNALQMSALEHQVRFSKLHEKRAEVIAELYKQLVDVETEGRRFIHQKGVSQKGYNSPQEPDVAEQKLYELFAFAEIHKIYLPSRIEDFLRKFYEALSAPFAHASTFGDIQSDDPTIIMQKREGFKKSYAAFQNEIPAARKALEQEFRILLGDTTT